MKLASSACRWVDTHAHLFMKAFASDRREMVARAEAVGVRRAVLPNVDESSVDLLLEMLTEYPDFCLGALGLHPTSVGVEWRVQMGAIERRMCDAELVAIGEIGIDLHWDTTTYGRQLEAFRYQLGLAGELGLPVLVHAREALGEVMDVLEEPQFSTLRVVLHAFTGSREELRRALDFGNVWVGIGGVATYRNGLGADLLRDLDMSRVVLETDAPYLTPVPHRGKRNEPSYIPLIGRHLAAVRSESEEYIAQETTAAAERLLGVMF